MRPHPISARRASRLKHRLRGGFSLLEVLIAVILVDVGLLALVAGSAMLVRQASETRLRGTALRAAANRLELLGTRACASAAGTFPGADGIVEHWAADERPNGVHELRDSVVFTVGNQAKFVVLRTRLPC